MHTLPSLQPPPRRRFAPFHFVTDVVCSVWLTALVHSGRAYALLLVVLTAAVSVGYVALDRGHVGLGGALLLVAPFGWATIGVSGLKMFRPASARLIAAAFRMVGPELADLLRTQLNTKLAPNRTWPLSASDLAEMVKQLLATEGPRAKARDKARTAHICAQRSAIGKTNQAAN
jgi:hypothetical protein